MGLQSKDKFLESIFDSRLYYLKEVINLSLNVELLLVDNQRVS